MKWWLLDGRIGVRKKKEQDIHLIIESEEPDKQYLQK
jgi:hypothetical protein